MDKNDTIRAWGILLVVFLSMGVTIGGSMYSFGLFVSPIEEQFGWTRTQISASISFMAVGCLTAPLLGRLMDRYGARPVMVFSLSLAGLSYFLRPLMTELWHWYALSLFQFGATAGATTLPVGRLVAIWFAARRGRMMGIAASGPNFGGLTLPPLIAAVLVTGGWQLSYVVVGVVSFVIAGAAFLVVREFPVSRNVGTTPSAESGLTGRTVGEALRSRSFYAITLALVLAFFIYSAVVPHIITHLTTEGLSLTVASTALASFAAAGIIGKIGFGILAEKITSRWALVVDLLGLATFSALMLWVSVPNVVWVVLPFLGVFLGGVGVLSMLVVQETFGVRHFGSISGLVNLATVVSFGLGPLLAGMSYDYTGSYATAFVTVAVLFVLGAAVLLGVRRG